MAYSYYGNNCPGSDQMGDDFEDAIDSRKDANNGENTYSGECEYGYSNMDNGKSDTIRGCVICGRPISGDVPECCQVGSSKSLTCQCPTHERSEQRTTTPVQGGSSHSRTDGAAGIYTISLTDHGIVKDKREILNREIKSATTKVQSGEFYPDTCDPNSINASPHSLTSSYSSTSSCVSLSISSSSLSLSPAPETRCGYLCWRPACLQPTARPPALLAVICWYCCVEAFISWGCVNVFLSTWQRRYSLTSTQTALIVVTEDFVAGLVGPIMGYLAIRWHNGRLLAFTAVCLVIGDVIFLLPQILAPPYELGSYQSSDCVPYSNQSAEFCATHDPTSLSDFLWVFVAAQCFVGVAGGALYGVSLAYLDDNIRHHQLPLYTGLMGVASVLGAVFGYLGGGACLTVYVDVLKVNMSGVDVTPSDPEWVGAWWIAFLADAVAALSVVALLLCFGRELPTAAQCRRDQRTEAHGGEQTHLQLPRMSWRDVGVSLRIVFTNVVFDLLVFGGILLTGTVTAFAAFLPMILQFQFGQTSAVAAVVAGAILIPAAALGDLLGGLLPRCLRLTTRGLLGQLVAAQVASLAFTFCLLLSCPMPVIAGVTTAYANTSAPLPEPHLWSPCNQVCNCTTMDYSPLCDADGVQYFSSCFAGCLDSGTSADGSDWFGNCSCIESQETYNGVQAKGGECGTDCWQFYVFVPCLFVIIILIFIQATSGYAILIRVVSEPQRPFAYTLQSTLVRWLGSVPIPLLFGALFDQACLVWQEGCGQTGSCWIYDNENMAVYFFTLAFGVLALSLCCNLAALCVYRPPGDGDGMEEEGGGKQEVVEGEGGIPNRVDIIDGWETATSCGQDVIIIRGNERRREYEYAAENTIYWNGAIVRSSPQEYGTTGVYRRTPDQ